MRSLALISSPLALAAVAVAARSGIASQTRNDYEWSYRPDLTADWYEAHGQALPETVPAVTVVEENKSYVVKLECLGCPFRVRPYLQVTETWQTPPQDNSILLNFTIDGSKPSLLVNGERITPFAPLPLDISAFQTPANLSVETMGKMVSQHMLDRSWIVGTKYGRFELEYEHAFLGTEQPSEGWVQFDITAIHMRQNHNPGSYRLDREGQQMVQLLLVQDIRDDRTTFTIKDIQVVDRTDREQPIKMPCGKDAIVRQSYNPLEWDYYGKIGTLSRAARMALWKTLRFLDQNALFFIFAAVVACVVSLVKWRIRRNKAKVIAQIKEDAEARATLLSPEYDDAPPEYSDIPESEATKMDEEIFADDAEGGLKTQN